MTKQYVLFALTILAIAISHLLRRRDQKRDSDAIRGDIEEQFHVLHQNLAGRFEWLYEVLKVRTTLTPGAKDPAFQIEEVGNVPEGASRQRSTEFIPRVESSRSGVWMKIRSLGPKRTFTRFVGAVALAGIIAFGYFLVKRADNAKPTGSAPSSETVSFPKGSTVEVQTPQPSGHCGSCKADAEKVGDNWSIVKINNGVIYLDGTCVGDNCADCSPTLRENDSVNSSPRCIAAK